MHRHSHDAEFDTTYDQHPYPAGHVYPTAATIFDWINSTGIIRAAKAESLNIDEIQKILDILVWDEKLENVNDGYRTVRGVKSKGLEDEEDASEQLAGNRSSGFTEAPCGQCPVIDMCSARRAGQSCELCVL